MGRAGSVEINGLRKTFRTRKRAGKAFWKPYRSENLEAIAGVDLSIPPGEFFGLLGPNGAGKTTTIRMLCTLLEPTAGEVRVNGFDVCKEADQVRASIGVLLHGERSTYWKLTAKENLEYFAALYHIPPRVARSRIAELLELVELSDRADEFVERYSSGMKQRLALAKALLNNPPLLMLDEPTVGLDPQSARNIREFIARQCREEGKTVILTTHYMEEADQLCQRVGIIDHGRIIALDAPAALKDRLHQEDVVEVEAGGNGELAEALRGCPGALHVAAVAAGNGSPTAKRYRIHTRDGRACLPRILETCVDLGARVEFVRVSQPTLEDVFINLTGKALRD